MRRRTMLLLALLLLCGGCAGTQPTIEQTQQAPEATAAPAPSAPQEAAGPALIGYIVEDDRSIAASLSMYGFLHMAENLGYPAKLYRAKKGAEAAEAVTRAVQDGCKGLLIEDPNGLNDAAVQAAVSEGVKVAVPFYRCAVEGVTANVIADETDYVEEITRGIASRMTERSLKSGAILLYGAQPAQCFAQFSAALTSYYPQFNAVEFQKTGVTEEEAVAELANYLLYNRNVKGMYVMDPELAVTAVKARALAIRLFAENGAPSPTPSPQPVPGETPAPDATPAPTIAPGLLTQISVTIFAAGLSDENLVLFNDNDIYGLCIEPYYEASAQAVMVLDQALSGGTPAPLSRVNRPIANAATIDKYLAIYAQTKDMFALEP